jgi:hypothetical protein
LPLFRNTGKGYFDDVSTSSGVAALSRKMGGFGVGLYDFANDGWKGLFITRGHVDAVKFRSSPTVELFRSW